MSLGSLSNGAPGQTRGPPASIPAAVQFVLWQMELRPELTSSGPRVELARAEVIPGRNQVLILPERRDMPRFAIPNSAVHAEGFSPGWFTHDYLVSTPAPAALRGVNGLSLVGRALAADPTPGDDGVPSPNGTRNDVGPLVPGDGGHNYVETYTFKSTDEHRSDAIVNYTIKGEHAMDEGFVLRFARLERDESIALITYGEGDALKQSPMLGFIWRQKVKEVWTKNAEAIFAAALRGPR